MSEVAERLIDQLRERPLSADPSSYRQLFELGSSFDLDYIELRAYSGEHVGHAPAQAALDQTKYDHLTRLKFTGSEWIVHEKLSGCYWRLDDWWPIFVFRRLESLIGELPGKYELELNEHLLLAKALGWNMQAQIYLLGGENWITNTTINKWLKQASEKFCVPHPNGGYWFVGNNCRWVFDPRWNEFTDTLQLRLSNLKVGVPDA